MSPDEVLMVVLLIIGMPLIFSAIKDAYAAALLMGANIGVFFFVRFFVDFDTFEGLVSIINLAINPMVLMSGQNLHTLVTSAFLHISPTHIIFNMIFIIFWAPMLESRIGARRLILVYLLTAVVGGLVYTAVNWGEFRFALGASGALFGIAGCFVAMYPKEKMTIFLMFIPLPRMKGYMVLLLMLIMEIFLFSYGRGNIANEAHLGGLLAGVAIGTFFAKNPQTLPHKKREMVFTISHLVPLATSRELGNMLDNASSSQEPEIVLAWVQSFLEHASCPMCRNRLGENKAIDVLRKGRVSCSCGWSAEAEFSPPRDGPR
ncbi:MAG: rhomboid family intramembrane serine protease [Candidatus Thermoplasmatota archaeon]|nr:rhomboid family intramembrane serine protease [Candidatus Thermoplasmatota archaeon]